MLATVEGSRARKLVESHPPFAIIIYTLSKFLGANYNTQTGNRLSLSDFLQNKMEIHPANCDLREG